MATTYNDATGDASELEFNYTFPTIEETNATAKTNTEVKVALDGITQAANRYEVLTTSPTKIKFNNTNGVDSTVQEADGAPKASVKVRVYRDTGVDSASVVFAAGSSIRAKDLNTVTDQGLYQAQEQQNQLILAEHIDEGAVTSVKIKDDAIVNADINSAAEIEVSKLKDGAARQVLQTAADGTTVEWTNNVDLPGTLDVTGATDLDGTLNVDGAATIQNNLIVKADNKEVAIQNASGTDKFTVDTDNGNTVIAGHVAINGVTGDGDAIVAIGGATFAGDVNVGAANLTVAADNKEFAVQTGSGVDKFTVDTDNGNTVITGSLTTASITGTAVKTTGTSTSDTQVYSAKRAGEIFYGKDTTEEIQSGETWSAADDKVATTSAIDARIIDLVDDVGGFVAIANETSFPNANPDVNNGTGTIVSVKVLASDLTSNGSGVATIANGNVANNATITINGLANSTTYDAGSGFLVETTTTLHTYTFHRLSPNATEITAVAGKLTEIGRLGTTAAVEDMSILGTTDCVADMAILGTADVVSDLNTLGTADVVSDLNTLATADIVSDMNTLATGANVTAMSNVSGSIANVNTVASNLTNVNNFAELYQIDDFDPNPPDKDGGDNTLAAGDLAFDTTADELKVYNGSSWQAGVTATGNLVQKSAVTTKGDILAAQGSANPVRLGVGSNGQVLKADSSTSSGLAWGADTGLTTEEVQDIVGGMFTGNTETNITATYEDGDGTIDLVSTDTNTQLTEEQVEDFVGGMVTGNTETGITVTYEDSDGTLDFVVASQTDENFTTADHSKLDGIEASADVTDATNVNAAGAVMESDVDAKGDIFAGTADNTVSRLAAGANTYVLTADSGEATGLKWAAPSVGTITALNNQTANRLTSIGATTTELDGEANLTFQDTTATGLISGKQITGRGFECPATVSDNWTIAAGNNAFFPGPMTVATGKTVTVPADRTLTVV